jgi:hypothetical protein
MKSLTFPRQISSFLLVNIYSTLYISVALRSFYIVLSLYTFTFCPAILGPHSCKGHIFHLSNPYPPTLQPVSITSSHRSLIKMQPLNCLIQFF